MYYRSDYYRSNRSSRFVRGTVLVPIVQVPGTSTSTMYSTARFYKPPTTGICSYKYRCTMYKVHVPVSFEKTLRAATQKWSCQYFGKSSKSHLPHEIDLHAHPSVPVSLFLIHRAFRLCQHNEVKVDPARLESLPLSHT